MKVDLYTKVVLTVIAGALVVLAVRSLEPTPRLAHAKQARTLRCQVIGGVTVKAIEKPVAIKPAWPNGALPVKIKSSNKLEVKITESNKLPVEVKNWGSSSAIPVKVKGWDHSSAIPVKVQRWNYSSAIRVKVER